jgi:hypothetical protein
MWLNSGSVLGSQLQRIIIMLMDNTNWLLEILDCLILNNEAK